MNDEALLVSFHQVLVGCEKSLVSWLENPPQAWGAKIAFKCVCIRPLCWGWVWWGGCDKKATARGKSRTIVLLLYTVLIAIFSYMYIAKHDFLPRHFFPYFFHPPTLLLRFTFSCQHRIILFIYQKRNKEETKSQKRRSALVYTAFSI